MMGTLYGGIYCTKVNTNSPLETAIVYIYQQRVIKICYPVHTIHTLFYYVSKGISQYLHNNVNSDIPTMYIFDMNIHHMVL